MKKWITIMLVCLIVVGSVGFKCENCFAAMKPDLVVDPQYELTKSTWATLSISSTGIATCTGYIKASAIDSTINITMKLLVKDGNIWKTYDSWTTSGEKSAAELSKTRNVEPGTYKLKVSGTVKTSTGRTETVTTFSGEKSYSK